MRNRIVRGILIGLALLVIVAVAGAVWYLQPLGAKATAQAALAADPLVTVTTTADLITFMPKTPPTVGFIFYPGAKVDPAAYSASLRAIADQGYAVFVVKFPLNFAVLGATRADGVIDANPQIKTWAIGGHSLGGAMACSYVKNSTKVKALIFWAAYCDRSFDLSTRTDVQVTSIYGTRDGLATGKKIEDTKPYAPASTVYVPIEGGNHAQFGDYGPQDGDTPATIAPEEATRLIVSATLEALKGITPKLT
jgi:pimeloyl-ACP methyl ester carboxylesterase